MQSCNLCGWSCLNICVGNDDHAANLCMGGLCGQNQWAALWAKPVFCYLWVCPSVGRSLLRHGPICKCQSGGAPLQPALALTKQLPLSQQQQKQQQNQQQKVNIFIKTLSKLLLHKDQKIGAFQTKSPKQTKFPEQLYKTLSSVIRYPSTACVVLHRIAGAVTVDFIEWGKVTASYYV